MEIKNVAQENNTASFIASGFSEGYVNALRRSCISLVPTLAIEKVEVIQNSSALYDEVLAHRLGLLPLTTDLGSYKFDKNTPEDDVFRPESQVKLTLKAQGPGVVCADQLESTDKSVKCAEPKMPIVKLLEGQEVELVLTAKLGQGTEHMKWAAGSVYYQHSPIVGKTAVDPKEHLSAKSKEVFETAEGAQNTSAKGAVSTESDSYLVTVESWGQMKPKEMLSEAISQLNEQLAQVVEAAKAMK